MELIFKTAALAVGTAVIALTIKRNNPEITTVLSLACVTVIIFSACTYAGKIKDLIKTASKFSATSGVYIISILKCLAVSIITKLCSDLCKDANQAALASAVEFTGSVCAMSIVLPLISNMLSLVGEMV